jgi:hypothetical protein
LSGSTTPAKSDFDAPAACESNEKAARRKPGGFFSTDLSGKANPFWVRSGNSDHGAYAALAFGLPIIRVM